jgi:hypothetical protein
MGADLDGREATGPGLRRRPRRPLRVALIAATVTALTTAALLLSEPPLGTPNLAPAAALQQAVTVSAGAADASGSVTVEITRDGIVWAAKTVRWNGDDLSVVDAGSTRPGRGELRVVGGTMYSPDPKTPDAWIELGSPDSVDPGSGTTPDDYLEAVREDAGGTTLRRITEAMADLATHMTDDGSTVYAGQVAAGELARRTGFKEGAPLRVLPYGYVAHDEAADPASLIAVTITVAADGSIREIAAAWGGPHQWSYRLTFSELGTTPPPVAPDNVSDSPRCRTPGPAGRPGC